MNRHTRWGFWMLVWLWAACAQAVGQTYQGRIGTQPVVMELAIGKDGQVQGRYFYRKYHADIALSGQRTQEGRLQLGENLPYDRSRTDFTLQAQGQGWQGQWKGPKARTALPVVLVPLEVSALRPFDPLVGVPGSSRTRIPTPASPGWCCGRGGGSPSPGTRCGGWRNRSAAYACSVSRPVSRRTCRPGSTGFWPSDSGRKYKRPLTAVAVRRAMAAVSLNRR